MIMYQLLAILVLGAALGWLGATSQPHEDVVTEDDAWNDLAARLGELDDPTR